MFSAKISTEIYRGKKQKIWLQSRELFQNQKILLKKMISPTLTHRQSGKVWKKPGLWTGS